MGDKKKGYNNPDSWEKFENKDQATVINVEENIIDFDEQPLPNQPVTENTVEIEELEAVEVNNEEDDGDILNVPVAEGEEVDNEEVLSLTEYTDGSLTPAAGGDFPVAEYKQIKTVEVSQRHAKAAKNFVGKVTKLVLEFTDIQLTKPQENFLKETGKFQAEQLGDLLYMVDINKQMLNNIIERVNVTQAEDYAIINSYNQLANQHLKLMKELQSSYKSIPAILKKMRAEIICNQDLELGTGEDGEGGEVVTEDLGTTHFNNGKQLRAMLEEYNENNEKTEANK